MKQIVYDHMKFENVACSVSENTGKNRKPYLFKIKCKINSKWKVEITRQIAQKTNYHESSRIHCDSRVLTKFDSKGTKRSVNVMAVNLCNLFFKNISITGNRRPSKFHSLHTYGVLWIQLFHSAICPLNRKIELIR